MPEVNICSDTHHALHTPDSLSCLYSRANCNVNTGQAPDQAHYWAACHVLWSIPNTQSRFADALHRVIVVTQPMRCPCGPGILNFTWLGLMARSFLQHALRRSSTLSTKHSTSAKFKVCVYWALKRIVGSWLFITLAFKRPPFRISEEGWGEFDMRIAFHTSDKSGDQSIAHDLNFQSGRYETKHTVVSRCFNIGGIICICWHAWQLPDFQKSKSASTCYLERVRTSTRWCQWSKEQGRVCKEKEETRQRSTTPHTLPRLALIIVLC